MSKDVQLFDMLAELFHVTVVATSPDYAFITSHRLKDTVAGSCY